RHLLGVQRSVTARRGHRARVVLGQDRGQECNDRLLAFTSMRVHGRRKTTVGLGAGVVELADLFGGLMVPIEKVIRHLDATGYRVMADPRRSCHS
ncbi:hypothetical protein, partial [Mycobacterium asiaticum]|uniref:hypothetical protein n=1 Tax=Mycobacterium asiaticum TaxID=1790 RepID=UPI000AE937BA